MSTIAAASGVDRGMGLSLTGHLSPWARVFKGWVTALQRFKFRKAQRIRTSTEFARILNRRCAAHVSAMGLYVDSNDCDFPRLGVRIGKRSGNAVQRVRARRRLREAFRRLQHQLPALDFIAVLRSADPTAREYEAMFIELAERAQRKLNRDSKR